MAPLAAKTKRLWRELVRDTEGRAAFALRLSVIAALTLTVTQFYGTPYAAVAIYLSFFLNRGDRATSILLNIALVVVVSLVLTTVLLIARAVIEEPGVRLAAMAVASLVLMFLGSASKLRPIAGTVALCIVYALTLLRSVPQGELATRGLLYAWLFVGIPAGVSLVVNLVIAPAPRWLAERALAARLRAGALALRGEDRAPLTKAIEQGVGEILARLRLAAIERTSRKEDLAALGSGARSSLVLLLQIDALGYGGDLEWCAQTADRLDGMARVLESGRYPLCARISKPRVTEQTILMNAISATLAQFCTMPAEASPKQKSGFFVADAFTNPVHVQHALKATAAAMGCYLLYSLLDWPGLHTSLITCYVASLATLGEAAEKLWLRIIGCLFGATAGVASIIWLLPHMDSLPPLAALIFVMTLPTAWIAGGSPRISYAGFQIAFAFYLCVVQGSGPSADLVVARDRVIGILLGNLAMWLVFTRVWPASVAGRIEIAITELGTGLAEMSRMSPIARLTEAPAFETGLATARADLCVLAYEPATLRPNDAWRSRHAHTLAHMATIERRLLLATHGLPNAGIGLNQEIARLVSPACVQGDPQHTKARKEEAFA